jgi:glycogen debranching enzyme
MPKSIRLTCFALAALFSFHSAITAQGPAHPPAFSSIPPIAFDTTGPVIRAHSEPLKPFTVAGERGVLLGQQDGAFEAWLLPVKVLSHLNLSAEVEGYSVPIDVNQQAAEIEVRPDRTIITYAHIAFTVRQIMFSPNDAPPGTGPVVLFEFDCLHPTDFTFRFTPNLEFMWPMRNEGVPGAEWIIPHAAMQAGDSRAENDKSGLGSSGYYVLHADYPDLAAALTIPGATAGILAPYQERPQVHQVELKLHIDPARDHGRLYPLLMAIGTNPATASSEALGATLEKLNQNLAALYQSHAEAYKKLLANSVSIDTPDKSLNEAFQWAVVSIEQLKAKPWSPDSGTTEKKGIGSSSADNSHPEGQEVSGHDFSRAEKGGKMNAALAPAGTFAGSENAKGVGDPETALVAGYFASGDSARPGFGWFFGRDSLYTLYAVNGYGDFALAKSELEFLIHRQRDDGKIMHEYSQTAAAIDWLQFPYMYAAADSTPLFLLATLDYVRASGDTAFLTANRQPIEKAWDFETSHSPDAAHGGNGIYTNEQGTGWVESWPGGMPHQEVYLSLLDQQASAAMAQIEDLLHDAAKSQTAKSRAEAVAKTINDQFYDADKHCYAFSRNKDGSLDRATTVYPALAWWSDLAGTSQPTGSASILQHPEGCLQQLASHTLNTDWGLRDVSNEEKIYDGMSYHQGSVWPLFTGWAALAEYRANQPLAGYQMLMENANLTKAQDLGSVTELLSGDYNVPFGRSTSHQLWSSAMVITPILRGLFGIDIDATTKTITVNPHLPASWNSAEVMDLQLPGEKAALYFNRRRDHLEVYMSPTNGDAWHLRSDIPGSTLGTLVGEIDRKLATKIGLEPRNGLRIPFPPLDIDLASTMNLIEAAATYSPGQAALPGARTSKLRITRSEYGDRSLKLTLEGIAGSDGIVRLIRQGQFVPKVQTDPSPGSGTSERNASISFRECDAKPEACPSYPLVLHFPEGEGWKTITVTLTW